MKAGWVNLFLNVYKYTVYLLGGGEDKCKLSISI